MNKYLMWIISHFCQHQNIDLTLALTVASHIHNMLLLMSIWSIYPMTLCDSGTRAGTVMNLPT